VPRRRLGLVARRVVFKLIQGWAKRTDSQLDVLLIDTLRGPIALWIVILGLHVATQNSEIPQRYKDHLAPALQVLWGLSFTIAISQFAGAIIRFYGGTMRGVQSVSSLSQKLVQFSILIIGCLWLAKVIFNFSLAPILTQHGYRVVIAATGAEALAKASEEGVDCLVLDLSMPLLTGIDVYRKLKAAGRELPTIFITGLPGERVNAVSELHSDNGVLMKPFDPSDLLRAIESATAPLAGKNAA